MPAMRGNAHLNEDLLEDHFARFSGHNRETAAPVHESSDRDSIRLFQKSGVLEDPALLIDMAERPAHKLWKSMNVPPHYPGITLALQA
jgi:hypothetical protein